MVYLNFRNIYITFRLAPIIELNWTENVAEGSLDILESISVLK